MKYLVNRETKEHVVYGANGGINHGEPFPWRIVEADSEGWIPWSGGECPLPDGHTYDVIDKDSGRIMLDFDEPQSNYWGTDGNISAYRPILSETAENGEASSRMEAPALAPQSVFIRLRQAVEAANTIPVLIAHINLLLPDGYCVTRCGSQPEKETDNANN